MCGMLLLLIIDYLLTQLASARNMLGRAFASFLCLAGSILGIILHKSAALMHRWAPNLIWFMLACELWQGAESATGRLMSTNRCDHRIQ